MDENNQKNFYGDNFSNNMNNNPQNEPNNGTFQNNTIPNNNVNESFTSQNQSINMSGNTYNPNNNIYNQAINNNMNNNSFNANTGNTYPNNNVISNSVNNTINTNNTNINTNQEFSTNNVNQNIPNKSKKSKLLLIILIAVLLIIVVVAIVLISGNKKEDKTINNSTDVAVDNNKKDEKKVKELWIESLDWTKIPEKENDLVLYSSFKAPITAETFEKHVTDSSFTRYEGNPGTISISPEYLTDSEEFVYDGKITFEGETMLHFDIENIKDKEKRIPLKDIIALGKYKITATEYDDLYTLLGMDKEKEYKSDEPNCFMYLVERYGRPNTVICWNGVRSFCTFCWKRNDYYFAFTFVDAYFYGEHTFETFVFDYVPENNWEHYIDDKKSVVMDFDEYIGVKSKVKKVIGDDSSKYINSTSKNDNM